MLQVHISSTPREGETADIGVLGSIPVVILAGGLGTRLRTVLPDRPKGLAPIGSCSFLEIQIRFLRCQGARQFVLCVGYEAEKIQRVLGDGRQWGVSIEYSVETDRLLGTAGALKQAEQHFKPRALVLNGDTYLAIEYEGLVRHHLRQREECGAIATLALTQMVERSRYGTVLLDADRKKIVQFNEKEQGSTSVVAWVSAGAYVVERDLLRWVPPDQPCSLERNIFPRLVRSSQVVASMITEQRFFDIGTPEGLREFVEFYTGSGNSQRCD